MADVVEIDVVPKLASGAAAHIEKELGTVNVSAGLDRVEMATSYDEIVEGLSMFSSELVAAAMTVNKEMVHTVPEGVRKLAHVLLGWAALFGSSKAALASKAMSASEGASGGGGVWAAVGKIGASILIKAFINVLIPGSALVITAFQLMFKTIDLGIQAATWAVKQVTDTFMDAFDEIHAYGESLAKYVSKFNPTAAERFHMASEDFNAVIGYILQPALEAVTELIRGMADGLMAVAPLFRGLVKVFATWPVSIFSWIIAKLSSLAAWFGGTQGASFGMASQGATSSSIAGVGEDAIREAFSGSQGTLERIAIATEKTAGITEKEFWWTMNIRPGSFADRILSPRMPSAE